MRFNPSPGPVFKFECLLTSRRWTHFAGRVLFLGLLLTVLALMVFELDREAAQAQQRPSMVKAGEYFFFAIISTQLSLLFLLGPAVAADAICLDKARGALLPLLTTQLSSYEIIMGKFTARCLPVCAYVIAGLPVMAICLLLGGIHPEVIFGSLLVCFGVALIGASGALLLSVLCTKPFEVILVCYLAWILFLLLLPASALFPAWISSSYLLAWVGDAVQYSNPFFLCFAPYVSPGSVSMLDFLYFFLASCGLSALFLTIATLVLRRVVIRDGAVTTKQRQRWWSKVRRPNWLRLPGPSLDNNPVLWREWHRQRPSRWVRAVWFLYALIATGASLFCFLSLVLTEGRISIELGVMLNAFQVGIGLLLVSVTSVTSFHDERTRGSLDVLLTTPLSSVQVFWGKWWGSFRVIPQLAIMPTLVASGGYFRNIARDSHFEWIGNDATLYFVLMPVLICCYGAWIVSVGVAIGVSIKRPGRAIAASVVVYILFTVGLLVFAAILSHAEAGYPAMGSCFFAPAALSVSCLESRTSREFFVPQLMLWCVIYSVASALLSLRACRSFDRHMSRMPERLPTRFRPEKSVRRLQKKLELQDQNA
jgi:ABC-type transport system involved in multi-copper enzyme maturation permease subunit